MTKRQHFWIFWTFWLAVTGAALANDYYTHGSFPSPSSPATSASMRAELDLISAGFDKLPSISGNANKAVVINTASTGLTTTAGTLSLAGNFTISGAFATTLVAQAPVTLTLPAVSSTLATTTGTEAFSAKTFNLSSNTLSGTTAQFNAALSDNDFATLTGVENLSNKSMISPTISAPVITGAVTGGATYNSVSLFAPTFSGGASLNGTFTGTYILAGTGSLTSPAISGPTLSGTVLGTYTLGGTPTITDSVFTVSDNGDTTKKVAFEVSGVSAGTTRTITIPNSSGTLAYTTAASESAAGLIELATQAEVDAMTDTTRAMVPNHNRIVLATMQATTSGTEVNFNSIPAGVRRIVIHFNGLSLSGTDNLLIQIGDAGGPETTGYLSTSSRLTDSSAVVTTRDTTGFFINLPNAGAGVVQGQMVLELMDAATFTWTETHTLGRSDASTVITGGGSKSLSAELDRLHIIPTGANTFDAGAINISYTR